MLKRYDEISVLASNFQKEESLLKKNFIEKSKAWIIAELFLLI